MQNLLPQLLKEERIKSYKHKRLAAALMLLMMIFVIGSVFTGSFYFLVFSVRRDANLEVVRLEKEIPDTEKQIHTEFLETTSFLGTITVFDRGTTTASLGALIEQFIPGVLVREVLYEKTETGKANISLRGVAEKREDLISFIERLRSVPNFTEVTSPVANLLKEEYLDFSITVTEILKVTATSSKK
jgi:hypothetical protein